MPSGFKAGRVPLATASFPLWLLSRRRLRREMGCRLQEPRTGLSVVMTEGIGLAAAP